MQVRVYYSSQEIGYRPLWDFLSSSNCLEPCPTCWQRWCGGEGGKSKDQKIRQTDRVPHSAHALHCPTLMHNLHLEFTRGAVRINRGFNMHSIALFLGDPASSEEDRCDTPVCDDRCDDLNVSDSDRAIASAPLLHRILSSRWRVWGLEIGL